MDDSTSDSPTPTGAVSLPKRKRRSADEIADRILEAAAREFESSGYAGATTAAIARRAGVTEAQIFRYFATKTDLFREAIFQPLNRHFTAFFDGQAERGDAIEATRDGTQRYIGELRDFIACHSRMLLSLIVAREHGSPRGRPVSELAGLNTYFERGAAEMAQRARGKPRVAPELMVRVSFAAVLGCMLYKDWLFPDGLASPAEVDAAIVDFVLDGISARDENDRD